MQIKLQNTKTSTKLNIKTKISSHQQINKSTISNQQKIQVNNEQQIGTPPRTKTSAKYIKFQQENPQQRYRRTSK